MLLLSYEDYRRKTLDELGAPADYDHPELAAQIDRLYREYLDSKKQKHPELAAQIDGLRRECLASHNEGL
jgi:hypothetical protein